MVIPEADIRRQRDYTEKLAHLLPRRGERPMAMVDTYGCQQNVADSQRIMGMLRDMGCGFTQDPMAASCWRCTGAMAPKKVPL